MTTIAIDERSADVIQELQDRARRQQLPFATYLRYLASLERPVVGQPTGRKLERFKDLLAELEAGNELAAAPLPVDFSREDIYFDHD